MAEEATWIRIQRKTFTRWCNTFLINRNLGIHIIENDLQDGIVLHNLMEILTGQDIKPKATKQKLKVQKVEQINRLIRFMKSRGLKIVAIGGEDIHDGNTKLILGLIWVLILRFQIEADTGTTTSDLLDWCNKALNPQGIRVDNFKDSWQDGRAFCGLVNALEPNTIDLGECQPENKEGNLNLAFNKAEQHFQFPKMLDAEDILEYPDDLSIMTYVAYFRGYLATNTADPLNCFADGEGLKSALVLKPGLFTVHVRNDKNEPAERGGAPIRCFLREENDTDVCRVNIQDNRNGTYSCNYECPTPGKFLLHVRIGPNPIKGSPFNPEIISGEPFPGRCVATGPGVTKATAGLLTEFKIQAKDSNGNNLDKGGAEMTATLKDPHGPIAVKIVDNQDGTYTGSYVPRTAGGVFLNVEVKTEAFGEGPISGCPVTVDIVAGTPVANHTDASGPGLKGANAGTTGVVTVQTRDEFENELKVGGAPILASLTSRSDGRLLDVNVVDNKDGTYTLNYIPEKIGKYSLEIRLGDQPIKNSPVEFSVLPGLPDPLKFEITGLDLEGDGSKHLVAGTSDSYKILARDAFGNVIKNGGLQVEGLLTGSDNVEVKITDHQDGTYTVTYRPTKAGDYHLAVKVDGHPIGGKNHFPITVTPAGPNGAHSRAHGPGLNQAKLEDESNVFTVEACDEFDNPVPVGGSKVGGTLKHLASGEIFHITALDNHNGTYTCSYPSISKAGVYEVQPTLNGIAVKNAPFKVTVNPGSFSLDNTIISFEDTAIAGLPGGRVQLQDSFMNALLSGGDSVEAELFPLSKVEVTARDNKNGTYDLVYPPDFRGKFEVAMKVNGNPVPSGPWSVEVAEEPLSDDIANALAQLVPQAKDIWARILTMATLQERQLVIRELKALVSGKPLTDRDIADLKLEEYPTTTLISVPQK